LGGGGDDGDDGDDGGCLCRGAGGFSNCGQLFSGFAKRDVDLEFDIAQNLIFLLI
jgi:hypothetical protein